MKPRPQTRTLLLAGVAACAMLAMAPSAHAGLAVPYNPDADALHLWHFEDGALNTKPTIYTDAVQTASMPLTNLAGTQPASISVLGANTLGLCASNSIDGGHVLAVNNDVALPNVSGFCNPQTGAYTWELLVKFTANPNSLSDHLELICGDDNSPAGTTRGPQWRIKSGGGGMEYNNIAGGGNAAAMGNTGPSDFIVPLPSSSANTWYHAAVSFSGYAPTNGDAPGQLIFYWTLLDPGKQQATAIATNTLNYSLGGAPFTNGAFLPGAYENCSPIWAVGGSARNNSGTVMGCVDEARVSDVARRANEMAFTNGGTYPIAIITQPPTNTLVGYGKPLSVQVEVSGSTPTFIWQHAGTNFPGQTTNALTIPSPDFSVAGNWQVIITNSLNSVTSTVAVVAVGAAPSELYSTGLDANGQLSAGDVPDPHWTLAQSSDPAYLGPNALVFERNYPVQFQGGDGQWAPVNAYSMWISPGGNIAGNLLLVAGGSYTYRTHFLLDTADPSTVTLSCNLDVDGNSSAGISDVLINGHSTGTIYKTVALYPDTGVTFTNSSFLVPGINTIDVIMSNPNDAAGLRVDQLQGIGQALPPGLPNLLTQPANQVVRDASVAPGSQATFSVVATGRPPLSYQWWADGAPLSGATGRTLTYPNPTAGAQGTHYSVVVANTSGSVTSQVATLTLVSSNQPPVAANYTLVALPGQSLNLALSQLVQDSTDPDHDAISYYYSDGGSTNGGGVSQAGASLVYYPVAGYVGLDQFSYTLSDSQGATAQGYVTILSLGAPAPFNPVLVGGTTNLNLGITALPAGYSAQWQFNGTNLPGATGAQLTIANAQAANVGAYRLAVTGSTGQATTTPAALVGLNGAPGPKFNSVPSSWAFNGYGTTTALSNNVLKLTDGATGEGRSAWFTWPQDISAFSASFIYQDVNGGGADGFAFVLQASANGTTALGPGGGALAYQGIGNSVALEFNIYAPHTVGIALEGNGLVPSSYAPTDPAVNLASGHPIQVNVSYAAGMAQLALTDLNTQLSTNISFDVVSQLGGTFEDLLGTNIAYVGFTGSDGGTSSTQNISNFVFWPPSISVALQATATNNVLLSWTSSYSGFVLQSAASLSGPWQNVTAPVRTAGSQYQVSAPLTGGTQFYRLSLP